MIETVSQQLWRSLKGLSWYLYPLFVLGLGLYLARPDKPRPTPIVVAEVKYNRGSSLITTVAGEQWTLAPPRTLFSGDYSHWVRVSDGTSCDWQCDVLEASLRKHWAIMPKDEEGKRR